MAIQNFFKVAACRQRGFDVNGNSAIRSDDPENPTLEPNMKCIGSPIGEIWPFTNLGWKWNPHCGGRRGRRGSAMSPFERVMVVSYRLSIVTVALSVTIRPQFGIEYLRRSNQHVGESLWAKISGSSHWSRPLMFGSAESEHPRLTNGEIISEEFQPIWSQSTNVTDRETDRQTICDPNTTLCTKVHCVVKSLQIMFAKYYELRCMFKKISLRQCWRTCLISLQRQNCHYFRCPVWKMKSW